ncbi:IF factor, partial [Podargus strigoides]|nr:IF factor [Podargus strigoides]
KGSGVIGNIYSMGLALQVLGATRQFYAPREWDCTQAFSVVYSHDYHQPIAIAQVLPALVGRSYLDVTGLDCTPQDRHSLCPSPLPGALISVHYSIINKLQGKHFNFSISVHVPNGSTLLKVLQAAEKKQPDVF